MFKNNVAADPYLPGPKLEMPTEAGQRTTRVHGGSVTKETIQSDDKCGSLRRVSFTITSSIKILLCNKINKPIEWDMRAVLRSCGPPPSTCISQEQRAHKMVLRKSNYALHIYVLYLVLFVLRKIPNINLNSNPIIY